jgi:TRAP transporter TAXI family solute receptor
MDAFSAANWGPQRLRVLWKGHDSENTLVVKGTSSIKAGADIKGKKVAYIPGNVSVNKINEAYLAFHNLKWEHVVKVNLPGFGEALKAIADGTIDTCMGGTAAAGVWEMQASPDGVRFLPMPSSDKAGWERLQKVCPFMYPTTAKGGLAAKDPKLRVEVAGYPAMMPIAYATVEDEVAYAVTKSIHVKYDWFKDRYSLLDEWTLENCDKGLLNLTLPMHPGSVKYLKEVGAWKPQHEKWQSEMLRLEGDRIKAWNKALAEAKGGGIRVDPRDQKWIDLWDRYLEGVK